MFCEFFALVLLEAWNHRTTERSPDWMRSISPFHSNPQSKERLSISLEFMTWTRTSRMRYTFQGQSSMYQYSCFMLSSLMRLAKRPHDHGNVRRTYDFRIQRILIFLFWEISDKADQSFHDKIFWIVVLRLVALSLVAVLVSEALDRFVAGDGLWLWWAWIASFPSSSSWSSHRATGKRVFEQAALIRCRSWLLDASASLIALLNCFCKYDGLGIGFTEYQNPGCATPTVRIILHNSLRF